MKMITGELLAAFRTYDEVDGVCADTVLPHVARLTMRAAIISGLIPISDAAFLDLCDMRSVTHFHSAQRDCLHRNAELQSAPRGAPDARSSPEKGLQAIWILVDGGVGSRVGLLCTSQLGALPH